VRGSGSVTLSVDETLDALTSGGGTIIYKGAPVLTSETTLDKSVYSEDEMEQKMLEEEEGTSEEDTEEMERDEIVEENTDTKSSIEEKMEEESEEGIKDTPTETIKIKVEGLDTP
jgi:hypothetical protein